MLLIFFCPFIYQWTLKLLPCIVVNNIVVDIGILTPLQMFWKSLTQSSGPGLLFVYRVLLLLLLIQFSSW